MRVVFERKSTTATGTINVMSPALRGAIFENIIISPTMRQTSTLEYEYDSYQEYVVKLHTSRKIAFQNL